MANKKFNTNENINALKKALKEECNNALTAVANDEPAKQFIDEVKIDLNNPSPVEEVNEDYLLEKVDATAITEKKYTEEERIRDLNNVYFRRRIAVKERKKRNDLSFCGIAPEDITKDFIVASKKWEFESKMYEGKYGKKPGAAVYPYSILACTPNTKFIYSLTCESCNCGVYPITVFITEESAVKILNDNKVEKKFIYGTANILCCQNGYQLRLMRYDLGETEVKEILTFEDALHKVLLDDKRFKSAEDQKEESSKELQ